MVILGASIAFEILQHKKEVIIKDSEMDSQAPVTHSMACCLIGSFRFLGAVLVLLVLLHSIHCSFSLSLNGLLMDTSIVCTSDVQPPGKKQ